MYKVTTFANSTKSNNILSPVRLIFVGQNINMHLVKLFMYCGHIRHINTGAKEM